jgi:hypothetical protein
MKSEQDFIVCYLTPQDRYTWITSFKINSAIEDVDIIGLSRPWTKHIWQETIGMFLPTNKI